MRFTDAHSPASFCSPSRYGLLSGRYPWRLHRTGNDYRLERDRLNIASLVKSHGYRSAAIGKWHLGYGADWNQPPITGPLEVGFDSHFGVPENHNDPYRVFIENHDIVGRKPGEAFRVVEGRDFPEGLAQPRVEDEVSETLVGKALRFIEDNRERPFFLYFASVVPHTHITPAGRFRGTSQAGLYGDYIQELDDHVGRILEALERGRRDGPHEKPIRTLTVLQGDSRDDALAVRSGPWKLIESKAPDGGKKHQLYDLVGDAGETKNIAVEKPEVVQELAEALAKVRDDGRSRP